MSDKLKKGDVVYIVSKISVIPAGTPVVITGMRHGMYTFTCEGCEFSGLRQAFSRTPC